MPAEHSQIVQRRVALTIEYDGSMYMGFQYQPNHPTIQGELEEAIFKLTKERVRIRGASRTDSGVHALGQVIDFRTNASYSSKTFCQALNHYLPADIKVQTGYIVPDSFHSRKDASKRLYQYRILNQDYPPAIDRNTHHWVKGVIDEQKMKSAAKHIIGTHDFANVTKSVKSYFSTVRKVFKWDVRRENNTIIIDSEANGFLRQQIRRLNAILLEIGKGNWPEETIRDTLESKNAANQWANLPPTGLCLVKVSYPNYSNKVIDLYETK